MRSALAIISVIVLAIHGVVFYEELSAPWQDHQSRYFEKAAARADNELVRATLAARKPAIEQVIVKSFGPSRVDRCMTCHLAADDPRFETDDQPLRTHPPIPGHKLESFGCTICHDGQGRAVAAEAAHEGGHDWPWPTLPAELIEANCVQCHTDPDWPQAPKVREGRRLFFERACYTCHTVAGLSVGSIGPDLTDVGHRLRVSAIRQKIEDPRATNPTSTMPRQDLAPAQVLALTTFLKAQQGSNIARAPLSAFRSAHAARPEWLPLSLVVGPESTSLEPLPAAERGAALLPRVGCLSCHRLGARDGKVAPDLAYASLQRDHPWLMRHFQDPKSLVPGSLMPPYPLPDAVFDDLSQFLLSQPPPLLPVAPAERFALLCSRCHGTEGKGDGPIFEYLDPRPRDLTKAAFMKSKTRERLITSVVDGVPGTSMAPWGRVLGPAGAAELVDWVLTNQTKASALEAAIREVPTSNPVAFSAESATRGEAIYLDRCWGCHGKKADGHGPNAADIVPRPRNLRNGPFVRSVTYARLHESIKYGVQGTAMPAAGFDFALSDEQIGHLINYIYSLNGLGANAPKLAHNATAR